MLPSLGRPLTFTLLIALSGCAGPPAGDEALPQRDPNLTAAQDLQRLAELEARRGGPAPVVAAVDAPSVILPEAVAMREASDVRARMTLAEVLAELVAGAEEARPATPAPPPVALSVTTPASGCG